MLIFDMFSISSLYEEYLGAPFPFGCYKQVFLPGDAVISTTSIGASVATFSADLLADEHIIDQVQYDIVFFKSRIFVSLYFIPRHYLPLQIS